jgi:hypothetical protein
MRTTAIEQNQSPATEAPNPCNIPNPAVTLSPACRAATHLRPLPSAIGAIQRPAESSHASLKTTKSLQSLRTSRAAAQKRLRLFHFSRTISKERQ